MLPSAWGQRGSRCHVQCGHPISAGHHWKSRLAESLDTWLGRRMAVAGHVEIGDRSRPKKPLDFRWVALKKSHEFRFLVFFSIDFLPIMEKKHWHISNQKQIDNNYSSKMWSSTPKWVPLTLRMWYEKAAVLGHYGAQNHLSLMLADSDQSTSALHWLRRAAKSENAVAQQLGEERWGHGQQHGTAILDTKNISKEHVKIKKINVNTAVEKIACMILGSWAMSWILRLRHVLMFNSQREVSQCCGFGTGKAWPSPMPTAWAELPTWRKQQHGCCGLQSRMTWKQCLGAELSQNRGSHVLQAFVWVGTSLR